MKFRNVNLLLIAFFCGFSAYLSFQKNDYQRENEVDYGEESAAKKQWELKMLMDPALGKIPEGSRLKELAFLRAFQENESGISARKMRGITWNQRGPWNVGGRTRGLAIDVSDPNHLMAGGVSGGIWQSKDAGKSWQKVSMPQAHPGCVSITQDPRPGKTHIWYALSGEIYGTSASGGDAFYLGDGAFRSLDNGTTWAPIASTAAGTPNGFSISFQGGWRIVASPVDTVAACLYMATYGTIYRSRDTGNTWTAVIGSGNNSYFSDVAVTSEGIVYAFLSSGGGTKGFYRSADGIHFTNITPSFLKSYDRTVIGINPNDENEVYFLSELPSDTSGGVKTTNYEGTPEYVSLLKYRYLSGDGSAGGGAWTNLSQNLPVNSANQFDKFNCQGGYDLLVKIQPGTNHVFVGGTNLYRSTDGFSTPNQVQQIGGYAIATTLPNFGVYPNHHPDQHELYFVKGSPQKAYSVSDGGVNFTDDINAETVSWENRSLGYITSQFYSIAIDESKPFDQYVLGGLQDNGNYLTSSNNLTSTWRMTINGDGAYNYIAPDRSFYVISTQLGNVRKVLLDERGAVLGKKRIDPAGYDKSAYNFINHLAVDPNDQNYLFMPIGKRLARLSNLRSIECNNDNNKLSAGWTISQDSIKTADLPDNIKAEITFVAISKKPAGIVYIGTSNKEIYRVNNPYSDQMTFTLLGVSRLPLRGYVSGISIDPEDANRVLVCYSNYNVNSLVYTQDGGSTWFLVGGNLEKNDNSSSTNPSVRCVNTLVQADGTRRYFAGTSIGLFSTDSLILATAGSVNNTVWQQESADGIGAAVVTDIRVRQADGYVAVATHGNGVFDSYYTGRQTPAGFNSEHIYSIYPNPANQEINFSFPSLSGDDFFEAAIFDVLGRRVNTALQGYFTAGTYTIPLSTASFHNGYYFIVWYQKGMTKRGAAPFIIKH